MTPQPTRLDDVLAGHFTVRTLTYSETAVKRGLDNTPTAAHLANLRILARALTRIEAVLGHAITLTSAYRAPLVNQAVGGVPHSAHAFGLAADLVCPAFGPPLAVATQIAASDLAFDQIIHEYGRWVHVAVSADPHVPPRRQRLTICSAATGYVDGLVACGSP